MIADDTTGREIRAVDEALEEAILRADSLWLSEHFAPDAMFVHADGRVERGDEFIERIRLGALLSLARHSDDLEVRRYGDAAILTGRLEVTVVVDGVERHRDMRFTRVYVREHGQWVFVSHQAGANTFNQ